MPAMAAAVSWQAGAISVVSRKAGSAASGPLSLPRAVPGGAGWVEAEGGEYLLAPLLGVEIDQLGVRGVGVLGDVLAAPVGQQILGEVEPLLALGQPGQLVGVELVDGVEGEDLDAGELAHALLAEQAMGCALRLGVARVAVAEGVGQRRAVGVHAHIVHGPAVGGDGADALGGERGALAQALFQAAGDGLEVPVQAAVNLARVVGDAVYHLDRGATVLPAQQADAAAFGAKIDGNEGACIGRNKGLVGRCCHLTSRETTEFCRIHHSTRQGIGAIGAINPPLAMRLPRMGHPATCELCYIHATTEEIASCELDPALPALEEASNAAFNAAHGLQGETLIAYALRIR